MVIKLLCCVVEYNELPEAARKYMKQKTINFILLKAAFSDR
jgi:hypothetical protein